MSLINKLNEDLKQAMRDKDEVVLGTLRMLNAAIRNKEISMRKGEKLELDDDQVIEVIATEVKKRKDSIESYEQGGRTDLADTEKKEMEILVRYMPEQASDEEIEAAVRSIISSDPNANFGAVMGKIMAQFKGKADGKRVGAMVKKVKGQ